MKILYTAFTVLLLVFGVAGNSAAVGPGDLGLITAPDSRGIGNDGPAYSALPSFSDEYFFEVNTLSDFGGDAISNVEVSSAVGNYTSFNTALYFESTPSVWTSLASHTGIYLASLDRWTSTVAFSPLDAQVEYKLVVFGDKSIAPASYGGTITVTPIPEPEIYAMMAAGLGIMGWFGRRRKQQAA